MTRQRICIAIVLTALAWPAGAIDINMASEMELDALRGIGPALSRRVLQERAKADFKDWPDLLARVKGLGPAQAAGLSAQGLTVGDAPYPAGIKSRLRSAGGPLD